MASLQMTMASKDDNSFEIVFEHFNVGAAPLSHLDGNTESGQSGHYSRALDVDLITYPGFIANGPGASTPLTNGDQTGAVTDSIKHIADKCPDDGFGYAVGNTKLFQFTASVVTSDATWPHTISGSPAFGGTVVPFQGALYYFYEDSSKGYIGKYDLSVTFDDDWGNTVPTGAADLELNAGQFPAATKQDLMVFGNGRYLGVYNSTTNTIAVRKLDFGNFHQVADVIFNANQWLIAVNSPYNATVPGSASIYFYDAAALSATLADEINLGAKRIGFIEVQNGVVYVAYQDLTATNSGFTIGYLNGRQLVPLRNFVGYLPGYTTKCHFRDMLLFGSYAPTYNTNGSISGTDSIAHVYALGASIPQLPVQISQYATPTFPGTSSKAINALAAPFGSLVLALHSQTGITHKRSLSTLNAGVTTTWRSITVPTVSGRRLGYIDSVVVLTKAIGTSARTDLILEANQGTQSSTTLQITTDGKRRHVFDKFGLTTIEDFRLFLNWANSGGSASAAPIIRKVIVTGHYVESGKK